MRRHTIKQPKGPVMAAIIKPPNQAHNRKSAMIAALVMLARNNLAMAGVVVIMLMVV